MSKFVSKIRFYGFPLHVKTSGFFFFVSAKVATWRASALSDSSNLSPTSHYIATTRSLERDLVINTADRAGVILSD